MTQDDIRRLMGGYATGSLSDAERRALFEAALDDQDLFDELAREQAIREAMAEPGARDRLIARLGSSGSKKAAGEREAAGGWRKPLAWGLATAFVVSMSVAAVMIMRSGLSRNVAQPAAQQDAKLETPQSTPAPRPAAPPASISSAPPATGSSAPAATGASAHAATGVSVGTLAPPAPISTGPAAEDRKATPAKKSAAKRAESLAARGGSEGKETNTAPLPAASPAPVAPPAVKELPTEGRRVAESAKSQENKTQQDQVQPSRDQVQVAASAGQVAQPAQVQGRTAPAEPAKDAPARTSAPATPRAKSVAQLQPGQSGAAAGGFRPAPAALGGAVGGLGGGGGGGARVPVRFAFDYTVEGGAGGELTLKFTADGYISIHFVPGGVTVVEARVTAGSTRREHIPANATEIDILFTAAQQAGAPGTSVTKEPKDSRAGTAEDPGRARIDLLLRLY